MENVSMLILDNLLTARFDAPFGNRQAVIAASNQRTLENFRNVGRPNAAGGDRPMLQR